MSKFITILAAVAATAFSFCSCSEKENDLDGDQSKKSDGIADYTIIYWGMTGKLDAYVSIDLFNLACNYYNNKANSSVQFVGLVKTSLELAEDDNTGANKGFDKTYYFETGNCNADDFGKIDGNSLTKTKEIYEAAFTYFNAKEFADKEYDMASVNNIAEFIKNAAKTHPARHYVFMTFGHGGGFYLSDETPIPAASTRGFVYDEYNEGKSISADAFVKAVQQSGVKIQTLVTNSCLMATLENMAAYAQCVDYLLASDESIYPGVSAQYPVLLTNAGDNEQNMISNSKAYVDHCVNTWSKWYTSYGFYDLKQMPQLMATVKDASNWYNTNYAKFQDQIDNALMKATSVVDIDEATKRATVQQLRSSRIFLQDLAFNDDFSKKYGEMDIEELVDRAVESMRSLSETLQPYGFVFADVMKKTLEEADGKNTSDGFKTAVATLKPIYEAYMTQLKTMAYINSTKKPSTATESFPYEHTSPSIHVFAMNEKYFTGLPGASSSKKSTVDSKVQELKTLLRSSKEEDKKKAVEVMEYLFGGTPIANQISLTTAETNYTNSVFDREVSWNKFLSQLDTNPSIMFNPDHEQLTTGK